MAEAIQKRSRIIEKYEALDESVIKAARITGGDDLHLMNERALRAAGKFYRMDHLTSYDLFMSGFLGFVFGIAVGYAWKFIQG